MGLWRGDLEFLPISWEEVVDTVTVIGERSRNRTLSAWDAARLHDLMNMIRAETTCVADFVASSTGVNRDDGSFPVEMYRGTLGFQFYGASSDLDSSADLDRRSR